MSKSIQYFVRAPLLCQVGGHLQLLVLLFQSLVKLGEFGSNVFFNVVLLIADYLQNFIFKLVF